MGSSNPPWSGSSTPTIANPQSARGERGELPRRNAYRGRSSTSSANPQSPPEDAWSDYPTPAESISTPFSGTFSTTAEGVSSPSSSADTSSHYSCTNLSDNNTNRRIPAQHVRNTVAHARKTTSNGGMSAREYPHNFQNTEKLNTGIPLPIMEFPIEGPDEPYYTSGNLTSSEARAMYNETANESPVGVVYHDPTKGRDNKRNMSLAPYRPSTKKDKTNKEDQDEASLEVD
ncbi:uncharacterized protein BP5553_02811 [Venustampulla echinocandica]|uniref:Uncharacterized protein n=1 Tax=Venustampulla echinocandica TaxID=2656787 RepID=A0A370TSG1_9HELO|nr:uncharacterized protein BP5553_02811 [Venustampulla echinocandica]RDL38471.1 hypothetical protein BP5553_02811 [Venustampulla echinocandica]